ncbi:MAG TPA: MurR/RpiR family transcriptional regulator [Limnochordia bacterium]|nr:MurR/RpiR family transcriptional regulator [Limnochordia bacterium]
MNEKMELSGAFVRIKGLYNRFTPSEQEVADYIFTNLRDFHRLTISEVAEKCGVSVATLTRFAKTCGYSGFPALRTSLIPDILDWQKNRYHNVALEKLHPTDPAAEVIQKFDARIKEASSLALSTIDPVQLEKAVHVLLNARRIVLIGNGGSLYLAASTALKFLKLGLTAIAYLDYNGMQSSALILQEGDVALAVSYSGTTRETLDSLSLAVGTGCTTIVCTSWNKSPMAKISDIQLVHGVVQQESEIGLARVIQGLVLDLLATTVALRINGKKST